MLSFDDTPEHSETTSKLIDACFNKEDGHFSDKKYVVLKCPATLIFVIYLENNGSISCIASKLSASILQRS